MLKRTLFATLALSAALTTAAAVLPALAKSRHAAASASAPLVQAPVDAASPDRRRGSDDSQDGGDRGRSGNNKKGKTERNSHD
jgi:hypothetical protein